MSSILVVLLNGQSTEGVTLISALLAKELTTSSLIF